MDVPHLLIFPTTSDGHDPIYNGGQDIFVLKLDFDPIDLLYLPAIFNRYINYFDGDNEIEPNDSFEEANGPLVNGKNYTVFPNDQKDLFFIIIQESGQIRINLSNFNYSPAQLIVFRESVNNIVLFEPFPTSREYILSNQPPGEYFIFLFVENPSSNFPSYILNVTYPN